MFWKDCTWVIFFKHPKVALVSICVPSNVCSCSFVFLQFCVLAVQVLAVSCGVVQHFEKTQICADPVMSIAINGSYK